MTGPWLQTALDLALALGATLRLTRFIVADNVPGNWWIKDPIIRLAYPPEGKRGMKRPAVGHGKRYGYIEGLSCPYCMSVWMAALVTLTLFLAGGPGDAADWWRYIAGFLTLAWLTGHIAARVGDTE